MVLFFDQRPSMYVWTKNAEIAMNEKYERIGMRSAHVHRMYRCFFTLVQALFWFLKLSYILLFACRTVFFILYVFVVYDKTFAGQHVASPTHDHWYAINLLILIGEVLLAMIVVSTVYLVKMRTKKVVDEIRMEINSTDVYRDEEIEQAMVPKPSSSSSSNQAPKSSDDPENDPVPPDHSSFIYIFFFRVILLTLLSIYVFILFLDAKRNTGDVFNIKFEAGKVLMVVAASIDGAMLPWMQSVFLSTDIHKYKLQRKTK